MRDIVEAVSKDDDSTADMLERANISPDFHVHAMRNFMRPLIARRLKQAYREMFQQWGEISL